MDAVQAFTPVQRAGVDVQFPAAHPCDLLRSVEQMCAGMQLFLCTGVLDGYSGQLGRGRDRRELGVSRRPDLARVERETAEYQAAAAANRLRPACDQPGTGGQLAPLCPAGVVFDIRSQPLLAAEGGHDRAVRRHGKAADGMAPGGGQAGCSDQLHMGAARVQYLHTRHHAGVRIFHAAHQRVENFIQRGVAEVTVDLTTYETRVDRFYALQDAGRIIHPVLAAGQIEGGVAQGVGMALYEKVVWKDGRMQNAQMTNYIMPTSLDVPDIYVEFDDRATRLGTPVAHGPRGAKGIGELPLEVA